MRLRVVVCILFCIFLLESSAPSQQLTSIPSSPPTRDSQAVSLFQKSITAMGGNVAVTQVQTVVAQGSLVAAPGSSGPTGTFIWEDQFGASSHEFASTFQSGPSIKKLVSGHGSPGFVSGSTVHKLKPHVAATRVTVHLPAVVLSGLLANQNCSLSSISQATINGSSVLQVQVHTDTDYIQQIASVQTWYFDPATSLPVRLEYRALDNNLPEKFAVIAADFSDFRIVLGLAIPFKIIISEDGAPEAAVTLNSVTINSNLSSSDFDLPTGGVQ